MLLRAGGCILVPRGVLVRQVVAGSVSVSSCVSVRQVASCCLCASQGARLHLVARARLAASGCIFVSRCVSLRQCMC